MIRISIKVIPNAKKNRIVEENGRLKVYVSSPAVDGKANKAVLEELASFYKVKKREVRILSGEKRREKVVEVGLKQ